jgi:hypothetical protein
MGCGGYSKISKPDVNGAVNRKITKDQVHVELGNKVKVNENGSTIIFVYGKLFFYSALITYTYDTFTLLSLFLPVQHVETLIHLVSDSTGPGNTFQIMSSWILAVFFSSVQLLSLLMFPSCCSQC